LRVTTACAMIAADNGKTADSIPPTNGKIRHARD
jgi:hypothetical protein